VHVSLNSVRQASWCDIKFLHRAQSSCRWHLWISACSSSSGDHVFWTASVARRSLSTFWPGASPRGGLQGLKNGFFVFGWTSAVSSRTSANCKMDTVTQNLIRWFSRKWLKLLPPDVRF